MQVEGKVGRVRGCQNAARARYGNLDNIKWMKASGCPWEEDTFAEAAQLGDLDSIKWIKSNGCPWDSYISKVLLKIVAHGMITHFGKMISNNPLPLNGYRFIQ